MADWVVYGECILTSSLPPYAASRRSADRFDDPEGIISTALASPMILGKRWVPITRKVGARGNPADEAPAAMGASSGPPPFHSEFQSPHQRHLRNKAEPRFHRKMAQYLASGLSRNSGVQQCRLHTKTNRAVSPASAAGRRTSGARNLINNRVRSSSSEMKIESAQWSRQLTP